MATTRANPPPYGSANDLPSVIDIRKTTKGLKVLARVFARGERKQLEDAERDLNALVVMVDEFYQVLGPRHWIFTEYLMPVDEVRDLLDRRLTREPAEEGFIEIVATRVESPFWDVGLLAHEAMRARRASLARARQHYLDRQWDSCTLVLITVMDGFVNDVETASRRGLHAREPEEMVAWDSVSGHHMGLTSAMREFQKPFRKRHDAEVFEVYRHGIVHGVVTNYNNQVVATKAWNMLSAVADWAAAKEKSNAAEETNPTARELWATLTAQAKYDRYRKSFKPSILDATDPDFHSSPVVLSALTFLESWRRGRWAIVGEFLPLKMSKLTPPGDRTLDAKRIYAALKPSEFLITGVVFPMASVAIVSGEGTFDGTTKPISVRWVHQSANGRLATPMDTDAKWILAITSPDAFFTEHQG